jgi:hypothetical protein
VTVDGRTLDLHEFTQGTFALFEVSRPAAVEIKADFNVRWVEVRPLSLHIRAEVLDDHHTIRFVLPSAKPVTVEFNDDLGKVLHLFAYSPETNPPKDGDPGVRYFGPGVHDAGQIELKDGETLYLAPGAWVKGSVRSVGAKGISILGRGVLDGTDNAPLVLNATRGWATPTEKRAAEYSLGRLNLIYLNGTDGARIEGITLFGSSSWTLVLRQANHTRIDGIRILNPSVHYGDDGIDVVSSSDVSIENAFIRTNDDCIVVKNLDNVATHRIFASGCTLWDMPAGGNALEIGFELGGSRVYGIRFMDIDILHVERGSAISIHNGDSAWVEDVSYDDIRVEDARRKLIDFGVLYAQYGLDRPATEEERQAAIDPGGVWDGEERLTGAEAAAVAGGRGHIRNVRVTNLAVVSGFLPYSLVSGFDADHAAEQVVVTGLTYLGRPLRTAEEGRFSLSFAPGFTIR